MKKKKNQKVSFSKDLVGLATLLFFVDRTIDLSGGQSTQNCLLLFVMTAD